MIVTKKEQRALKSRYAKLEKKLEAAKQKLAQQSVEFVATVDELKRDYEDLLDRFLNS